ncbi:hypothetical protein BCV70DRAFT_204140 [Testicularia cyperi]|uniref:Uncharacterized protein n=1 Tax=Testicularia cyperi TaxID=1882483 RepID=A0A317XYG9_9BASI|nr:hypothetical protein BCV70DRAFT_204140 [Testicularia cyperi]
MLYILRRTCVLLAVCCAAVFAVTIDEYRAFYNENTVPLGIAAGLENNGLVLNGALHPNAQTVLQFIREHHGASGNFEVYRTIKPNLQSLNEMLRYEISVFLQPDNIVNQHASHVMGENLRTYRSIMVNYASKFWVRQNLMLHAGIDPHDRPAENVFKTLQLYIDLVDKGGELTRV